MKREIAPLKPAARRQPAGAIPTFILLLLLMTPCLHADQVETVNGDRYTGRVISLNADTLVLQSDVLGTLRVPRGKVSIILLGSNTVARSAGVVPATADHSPPNSATNGAAEFSALVRQLGTNTALLQQVRNQFLAGAGPEANTRFDELVGGLASGRLTLNDLRVQAKSAADQLRALQRDLGADGWAVDGYLSILDKFVKEAETSAPASANPGASSHKP